MKYVHVVNLKAYKDDPQKVMVFLSLPFSTSQARIIYKISKMDDSLHPKHCERKRFRVVKFPNRITRLIHQMWDEMVSVIVIKKDNKIVTTFKATQTNVEGSSLIRVPKKQKKEVKIEGKKEKMFNNLAMKNIQKALTRLYASMSMNQSRVNFQTASPLETSPLKG